MSGQKQRHPVVTGCHPRGAFENGSRIIELSENKRDFQTWIRLRGGKIINRVEFR